MNSEYKKLWLEALRSKKYTQTFEEAQMPDENKFCAVWLLFEISGFWNEATLNMCDNPNRFIEFQSIIREKFQITDKEISKIINLNDEKKWSFDKIAEYIEKNL